MVMVLIINVTLYTRYGVRSDLSLKFVYVVDFGSTIRET